MNASLPRGVRDFSDIELKKRNYIINTLKRIFQLNGFQEIQTPTFETIETLTKKYGADGEQLIFKILNSGDFLKNINVESLKNSDYKDIAKQVTKNALRYDLTVPFARYLIMHQNDINLPFKRYQIQPVWRADRPQKGRYREFYQCDIDIAGSMSLLNEAEVIHICVNGLKALHMPNYIIKINSRKILYALKIIAPDYSDNLMIILDKYDKIGIEGILSELNNINLNDKQKEFILSLINISQLRGNIQKIGALKKLLMEIEEGLQGINEIEKVLEILSYNNVDQNLIEIDTKLARGLSYYTGLIVEAVCLNHTDIGSICGGGRYDDLTRSFSKQSITGMGLSFGIDRIYSILETNNKFPEGIVSNDRVLILNLNAVDLKYYIYILNKLHSNNIKALIYPELGSITKQLNYANKEKIKYVVIP
ncbi:MAG: histidine--tRNA ligase [Solitalea-like symbiont of Acarus siro]